jgi:hypothetical protein
MVEFTPVGGDAFSIGPADILLVVDHIGTRHKWYLIMTPWKRAYVVFNPFYERRSRNRRHDRTVEATGAPVVTDGEQRRVTQDAGPSRFPALRGGDSRSDRAHRGVHRTRRGAPRDFVRQSSSSPATTISPPNRVRSRAAMRRARRTPDQLPASLFFAAWAFRSVRDLNAEPVRSQNGRRITRIFASTPRGTKHLVITWKRDGKLKRGGGMLHPGALAVAAVGTLHRRAACPLVRLPGHSSRSARRHPESKAAVAANERSSGSWPA